MVVDHHLIPQESRGISGKGGTHVDLGTPEEYGLGAVPLVDRIRMDSPEQSTMEGKVVVDADGHQILGWLLHRPVRSSIAARG